ncbi:UDP-2,4-diacetamido-2,4,6-trideoxy-beta-L-altropyranose hydrolase [Pseudomonas sichuanensis]|uniref:UDP-2,4-diacetamido-2,4, 6-trideoxy-beta-L-altropyranose hydrolase n=1 Tax=Pseudomonas sichuanensis TaxID=2213015 RepID=UPI00215F3EAD|nr:UDP-2,4-diacetamido-2,4,6-trideoxy-beta-L-altropyranose hydrolase [Pseudomonas sichuanensis]
MLRVDASPRMGTGHFMRCLTLADALARRGAKCVFLSRGLPNHLGQLLQSRGHELFRLPMRDGDSTDAVLAHSDWLGTTQQADAEDSLAALGAQTWDWLVVDHYALDHCWEAKLRQVAHKILVIDDLADREHDCDLLLDQNLYHDMLSRYDAKVPQACRRLLGPRFALLRDEFREARASLRPRDQEVKRVLVFFGGVDERNFTGQALAALVAVGRKGFEVDVVLGALHPQREAIEALCLAEKFQCHVQTTRMAELMANADLAIGAGGGATWERCCLGLVTLALSTADNQRKQLEDAAAQGLVYALPPASHLSEQLAFHLQALLENCGLRKMISSVSLKAVDGLGAQRVAACMGCTGISVRLANAQDSQALHRWRNHPSIRMVSRDTREIAWEDHSRWFEAVLEDQGRLVLIGEYEGEPVGVVRFDLDAKGHAEVSIYLVPEGNSRCRGGDLLQSAEDWVVRHRGDIQLLHAYVKGFNKRSNGLFVAAGYEVDNTRFSKKLHEL